MPNRSHFRIPLRTSLTITLSYQDRIIDSYSFNIDSWLPLNANFEGMQRVNNVFVMFSRIYNEGDIMASPLE